MQEKKIIAMLGGGQLGLMFTEKAQMMGEKVLILDPDPDCPAGKIADKFINADYSNIEALKIIIDNCDVCTTEFENIPYETLDKINSFKQVIDEERERKKDQFIALLYRINLNLETEVL